MTTANKKKKPKKSKSAAVVVLALLALMLCAVAGYFIASYVHRGRESADTTGGGTLSAPQQPAKPSVPPPVSPPQTANVTPPAVPRDVPPAVEPPPTPPSRPDKDYPRDTVPTDKKPRPVAVSGSGQLAVIIDDMGSSLAEARSLSKIGVPLTFSIIPGLKNFRDVASFAAEHGIETMIHIPMQSKGWPGRRLESNGLLVSMIDDELRERVAGFIRDIPGAVGVNNHMGSEFTEHADKMRSVIGVLKGKNLYFIDSATSSESAGLQVAREVGVKSGRRNVFLDNRQDRSYILGQLAEAVRTAKRSGAAIAICHPHPATIAALAEALPGLVQQGVTLVPASKLVR
ncbi:MAG: divergent polysaccharide deacetylase family protein [Desulfuromonadales bacterium]